MGVKRLVGVQVDFTAFYEAEAPRLVRSVALATGEPALAEEAVAEAFARAWARWPTVRTHKWPGAWVMRVALNESRNRFRRRAVERRKAPVVARPEAVEDPQPHAGWPLWDAVRELPKRERTLIALRYVADLTQAEIAELLDISPGTVAAGLHRARQKLAHALDGFRQEEPA